MRESEVNLNDKLVGSYLPQTRVGEKFVPQFAWLRQILDDWLPAETLCKLLMVSLAFWKPSSLGISHFDTVIAIQKNL
jgi:hypothetical protein